MGKLKIIAKSHMFSKTAPIFFTFAVCISVFIFCGDFSLFVSYAIEISSLKDILSLEKQNIIIAVFSVVGTISLILLSAPLRLGTERWFMLNAKNKDPKFKEIFFYFSKKRYKRCVFAWLFLNTVKVACAILFFFPFVCLSAVTYFCLVETATAYPIIICLVTADVLLLFLGSIFMFFYSSEFVLFYPIIVSTENVGISQALSYSKEMTHSSLLKISTFRLSFFPWWLLCIFVFPTFYCWGYYRQSLSVLAYRNEYLT